MLLTNEDLIFWNAGSWSLSLHNVTASAVAPDGVIYYLSNGNVYSHQNGSSVEQVSLGNVTGASWTVNQLEHASIPVTGGGDGTVTLDGQPAWLDASASSGAITLSGTPTQAGTYSGIVVSWSVPGISWATVSGTYTLVVHWRSPSHAVSDRRFGLPPCDPLGERRLRAVHLHRAVGGIAPGPNGPGLSLNSAGVLSGTATRSGSYTFTVQASDRANPIVTGMQTYTITVLPAAPHSISVSGVPSSMTVGGKASVTVTVQDVYGNACSNVPVAVGNNYGTFVRVSPSNPVTNGAGQATLTLTALHSGNVGGAYVNLSVSAGTARNTFSTTVYPSLFVYTCVLYAYDAEGDLVDEENFSVSEQNNPSADQNAEAAVNAAEDFLSQQLEAEGYDMGLGSEVDSSQIVKDAGN